MSKPERDALVALVRDGLERLSRSPEEWLPDELVAAPGDRVGMFIMWSFEQIDIAVAARQRTATRWEQERIALLTDLIIRNPLPPD